MIKLKLNREELSSLVEVFSNYNFWPEHTNQKIILGIVEYEFILPARKKLLSDAQRFTFNLRKHQVLALTEYFKAIEPKGAYEKVRVYNLLDQALRQV